MEYPSFTIDFYNLFYNYHTDFFLSRIGKESSEKVFKTSFTDWGGGVERHSKGLEPYLPSLSMTFSEVSKGRIQSPLSGLSFTSE